MKLHKTIPLHFEENDYEIRVLHNDKIVNVAAFSKYLFRDTAAGWNPTGGLVFDL
ncbi:MAG: hypothetical protein GY866_06135 [Proteobacteria bacterium]|nr:hypothetical protein [Pseudomonadota bacterium]